MTEEELKDLKEAKRLFEHAHQMIRDYAIILYKAKQGMSALQLPATSVRDRMQTIGHVMVSAEKHLDKVAAALTSDHQ